VTKYLFVDRDGTLIAEPADFQIDSYEKFALIPGVIPSLLEFSNAGYRLIMVTNQDGLGTEANPLAQYEMIQRLLTEILSSQGIRFEEVLVCPHAPAEACACRKPKTQLVRKFIASNEMDRENSFVIGDRATDIELAENMGLKGFRLSAVRTWEKITREILDRPRTASVHRKTNETSIDLSVNLDDAGTVAVQTGLGFFDHMLEQIARHGGFGLTVKASGDLQIDDHHLVEDVAIALGSALKRAVGDKRGIGRYGFWLPMDEASSKVAIDISGRAHFAFKGNIPTAKVGEINAEMFPHFFSSLASTVGMALHIECEGENSHHMVESMFKATGRALRPAFAKVGGAIPSTKGIL
jgi:imidazoleglycerol-phosphate dehydratase/histidinol-phosphatase